MGYNWSKQKEQIEEVIQATHNPLKEWCQDPKGYFLIRVNKEKKRIEVGFVTNNHIITKEIVGKTATAIYNTIIRKKLITCFEHAAYLGKELYKAELALKHNLKYKQEFPLNF
ncbi:DUF4346 domain-containing protein [Candidatus Woesearchaeota archaeon]|jgi:dihydropteroate synthase|nr:DUF4346 domain-containing protein [Candidatus Woesearchaeota archaeon]MBT5740010.1 DUF4346 domain-containing protein [Candidatus Woesearchaeota archaeon]